MAIAFTAPTGACCDGLCQEGTCQCLAKGEACRFDRQCCGDSICTQGTCRIAQCLNNRATGCDHPTDCCYAPCEAGRCCGSMGGPCAAGEERSCCDQGARCFGDPPVCRTGCLPPGSFGCAETPDCCEPSTECTNEGYCTVPHGADCTLAPCNFPYQCDVDGKCCSARAQSCTTLADCCSGLLCDDLRGSCCIPDGSPCELGQGCCGKCEYDVCVPND